jgi:hypothetical protein
MKKIQKYWLYFFAIFCVSCEFPDIPPPVSDIKPEFSLEENAVRLGNVISGQGNETIVILSPVTGISLKDGKIKLNENVSVKNENVTISEKNNIYGDNGLIIDAKKLGASNLKYAGYEMRTEIRPPLNIAGTISVTVSIRDLNNNKALSFVRVFRKNIFARVSNNNCSLKDGKSDHSCNSDVIQTYSDSSKMYQAGTDKSSVEHEIDVNILGKWILNVPSFTWQSDAKTLRVSSISNFKIQDTEDDSLFSGLIPGTGINLPDQTQQQPVKDTSMGFLDISSDKTYVWTRGEKVLKGNLEEVVPRTYADPKLTYWKFGGERENYYIFSINGLVYIYNDENHLYAIEAKR